MEVKEQQDSLEALKKEFSRFKSMLGQTQQARSKRAQNATTFDMIVDIKSSTRYRRRQESNDCWSTFMVGRREPSLVHET